MTLSNVTDAFMVFDVVIFLRIVVGCHLAWDILCGTLSLF